MSQSQVRPSIGTQHAGCKRACAVAALVLLPYGTAAVAQDIANEPAVTSPVSIAALHSDFNFALVTPARMVTTPAGDAFFVQATRIAQALTASSAALYPEAIRKIGKFDVFVADSPEVSVRSSASGQIALNAGIGALKPTDDWLALVVSREMAHVIAGHHDDNSTASIITSIVMNLVLPGSGLLKSALSFAGSQLAAESGREKQVAEADTIAVQLLEAAGYAPRALALNLAIGPTDSQLGNSSWARTFAVSSRHLMARMRGNSPADPAPRAVVQARAEPAGDTPAWPPVARARPEPAQVTPAARPVVASTDGHLRGAALARLPVEEIVFRTRPSGLSGQLDFGGNLVPARRIE